MLRTLSIVRCFGAHRLAIIIVVGMGLAWRLEYPVLDKLCLATGKVRASLDSVSLATTKKNEGFIIEFGLRKMKTSSL